MKFTRSGFIDAILQLMLAGLFAAIAGEDHAGSVMRGVGSSLVSITQTTTRIVV